MRNFKLAFESSPQIDPKELILILNLGLLLVFIMAGFASL